MRLFEKLAEADRVDRLRPLLAHPLHYMQGTIRYLILMRECRPAFAYLADVRSASESMTDAIYTTPRQMSSQNIARECELETEL